MATSHSYGSRQNSTFRMLLCTPSTDHYETWFDFVIFIRYYMCLVGSCQCRLNSALESCGTGVLTGVTVLAVYVSQIND